MTSPNFIYNLEMLWMELDMKYYIIIPMEILGINHSNTKVKSTIREFALAIIFVKL